MPGKRVPESFTPASSLKSDSIKSPMTAATLSKTPRIIECSRFIPASLSRASQAKITLAAVEAKIPPANPSQVFPGLIRGIILCLPKSDPAA